ncbi:sn-glycerol-1-phosphate dehydrogenase [Actinomyces sp. F1_1611]
MSNSLMERAVAAATDTKEALLGRGVVGQTGALFARLFPGQRAVVVADENTYAAAGTAVVASLKEAGVTIDSEYIFPGTPTLYAGYSNVEQLREYLRPIEGASVCSIGAGTLSDLAKLASGELGRSYLNVCTAASVDGFASFGASISKDGFKSTHDCPAPAGLVADFDIIAAAPKRLTATGYGDLIEKIPAGADWILADALEIEPIDQQAWDLVQGPLRAALADPERIGAGDPAAIVGLTEGNIMSGLAMQAVQSSRPASGAGHQFSHVWEMEGHGTDWDPPLSHGFKVGVGTVASCALWAEALQLDLANLDVDRVVAEAPSDAEVEARVRALLDPRIVEEGVKHTVGKHLTGTELRDRLNLIKSRWPQIVDRAVPQLSSPEQIADQLARVGAPYHPEMIQIDWDRFRLTHFKAQMIRPRYTILDLLVEVGMLDEVVSRLFSAEGYWGRHRHP